MHASFLVRRLPGLLVLCLPLAAAAQGVLRGAEPTVPRQKADPPEVQVTRLPSGQLLKRLPGDGLTTAASATAAPAPARGMSVQQVGNAQLRAPSLQGTAKVEPAPVAARAAELSVRQVGQFQVLEMRGERTPAVPATAASSALPAAVVIVDLPAGQSPPWPPAPNTLYRRTASGG